MTEKQTSKELEQKDKELEKLEGEHKRMEESLIGDERLFRAITEQSGEGITLADVDGNYVFINPAFCKMTGYSEAELLTMNVLDLKPPELGLNLFPKVLKNQSGKREIELVKKGGSRFSAEIVGYPIRLENQLLVLGTVRDITDQKKIEESLKESEKTARALLDATTESAFLIDIDGNFILMNQVTSKRFGKNIDDLLGKCSYDFTPPEIVKSVKDIINKIVSTKEPVRFENRGHGKIFDNHLYPVMDPEGNVVRIAIFARDITKEKQAEEAMRASEAKYKFLAENSTDVIYKLNLEKEQYTYASPSAERIFGYTNTEILGLKVSDIVTPESYAHLREKLEVVLLQGRDEPEIIEIEVLHKDGRVIPVEINVRILFDEHGIQEILGIARDITLRKEAEEALIKEKEKLEEAISQINQLSGLLPICSLCKKIRDDKGYWKQIESYIKDRSEADFSHSICPDCAKILYPEFVIDDS